jgi:hypothetical protein
MGVYDYLKGPCPVCNKELGTGEGTIQIKWFTRFDPSECMRTFTPGDEFPIKLRDGDYITNSYPCSCRSNAPLLVKVRNNRFAGFSRVPEMEIINIDPEPQPNIEKIINISKQKLVLPVKMNIGSHILRIILLIEIVLAVCYYGYRYKLYDYIKPDNIAGTILLGIFSSALFSLIAFIFAMIYGDRREYGVRLKY